MHDDIRILAWNPNGLMQHQQELKVLLDIQKIDICLISETHFTKQSHLKFSGYQVYHTVHPDNTARGGSAVIVNNSIQHYEEEKYETKEIQATTINVVTKNHHRITVSAIYCPPRHNLKRDEYIIFLKRLGEKFIIGGDFNAKHTHWGSRLTTTKGKELLAAAMQYQCNWHSTGKPTYWPTDVCKTPDLLDFFLTRKLPINYIKVEEGYDSSSDHSSILLTLSDKIITKEYSSRLTNKRTDWKGFQDELQNRIELMVPLRTKEQLNQELEKFVVDIQQSAWNNTPEIKRRTIGNNYPKEIRDLVAEKRKARKKWQRTRRPADKTKVNNLTQTLRREIQYIKNDSINTYLQTLTYEKDTNYSLWKATKKLKQPIMQIPHVKTTNGSLAKSNEEKAKVFADHLEHIFKPNISQHFDNMTGVGIDVDEQEIALTTIAEVTNEIRVNLNPKKSPGFDLITGEILKQIPKKGIIKLTNIINAAIRLKYVPSIWKFAEVIMIPKIGKPSNEISSYRPISLLPTMSKLFEKILLKRLKPIIERLKLVPNHQFGFRDQHSTIDQVHRITDIIEKTLEEKKICSTIFLDVAQAFDKVWHEGFVYKLKNILPHKICEILESYITERHFRVKQENAYSEIKEIKAGVPQGSVLGPVLYLLYTSDIPHTENTILATFADDTAILAVADSIEESTLILQNAMNSFSEWTEKWGIRINENKSTQVDFTNKKIRHLPVMLNNVPIPHANTAKYLGMNLDAKLRWKVHVKKKCEELRLKYRKLYWLMGRNSQLSINNKLMLYRQVLKPTWTYGIQLWGCTKASNLKGIQTFQNKVLRDIVNAPWYVRNDDLHRDLGVETVTEEASRYARKHEERLRNHPNVEANKLLHHSTNRRLKRKKPFELAL